MYGESMSRSRRRIIFFLLIGLFAVFSPVVISAALGYSLDPRTLTVRQTGGIFIKSKTPRLSLYLDGALIRETGVFSGSALITDVEPGERRLDLEKEGYRQWSKIVPIEPFVVTELRNVILIPASPGVASSSAEERLRAESFLAAGSRVTFRSDTPEPSVHTAASAAEQIFKDKKGNLALRTATSTRMLASRIHSFFILDERTVYFADENGFLGRVNPLDGAIQTLGRPGFYMAHQPFAFVPSGAGDLAVLDSAKGVFFLSRDGKLSTITGDARAVAFDAAVQKLLIVKEKSVEVLWVADTAYQPFRPAGEREEILRLDDRILEAWWYHGDSAHVIVRTPGRVLVVDVDGRGGHAVAPLAEEKVDRIVTVPDLPAAVFLKKGKAFFTLSL